MSRSFRLVQYVPSANTFRVKKFVPFAEGDKMMREKRAAAIEDGDGNIVAFELLATVGATPTRVTEEVLPARSDGSSTGFSKAEIAAIVMRSSLDRLTEEALVEKIRDRWAPRGRCERAKAKLAVYKRVN